MWHYSDVPTESNPKLHWTRSTFCSGGNCVEVAKSGGDVLVRDSKNPDGPVLEFTGDEWAAFIAGAAAGEFC